MPVHVTLPRLMDFLSEDLDRLRQVLHSGDELTLWRRSWDVLRDLYDADQWCHHANGREYRAAQRSSADGQVLGGLIWFRGRIQHHGLGWDHVGLVEMRIMGTRDGELIPVQVFGTSDGELKPVKVQAAGIGWPPFEEVPDRKGSFNDRGADEWYRDLVAQRGLVSPLERAHDFLATCA